MRSPIHPLIASFITCCSLSTALAQTEGSSGGGAAQEQANFTVAMRQEIAELRAEVEKMKARASVTRAEVEKLKTRSTASPEASQPGGGAAGVPSQTEAPGVPAVALDDEEYRLERERAIRSVARNGVLLHRNEWEVEPSFAYSHWSTNLLSVDGLSVLPVLVVGEVEGLRVERDTFQASLTLRYGILDNLQADVTVPYRYEYHRFVRQVDQVERKEESASDYGMGDVEFGLTHQLLYEQGLTPDLLLSLRGRAPTGKDQFEIEPDGEEIPMGTGVWGVRGGLTAIKALDPIVLILSGGFTWNAKRDITIEVQDPNNPGETLEWETTYEPGGMVDWGLGIALAVNPALALNFQFQQRVTFRNSLKGFGEVDGSSGNQADVRFGFGWALTHDVIVNFVSAAGLTEDTPDMTTSLGVAIKF